MGKFLTKLTSLAIAALLATTAMSKSFSVTDDTPIDPAVATDAGEQQAAMDRLKQRAIHAWVQQHYKDRYQSLRALLTPEIEESFITQWKKEKSETNQLKLEIDIDEDRIRQWVKLSELKTKQVELLSPILVVDSRVPNLMIRPSENANRIKSNLISAALLQLMESQFRRLGMSLSGPSTEMTLTDDIPNSTIEIRNIAQPLAQLSKNALLWVKLTPTAGGHIQSQWYFYNLNHQRVVLSRTFSTTPSADWKTIDAIKEDLRPPASRFGKEIEDLVSGGKLVSSSSQLVIQNMKLFRDLSGYRALKQLGWEFKKLDFLADSLLKEVSQDGARFEILSSKPPEDLARSIEAYDFPGFKLKLVQVDSSTLVMRYLR